MIQLEHVSKSFSEGIPALNDVSLHISEGEFVFVVGDSGSGKSTLIKLLLKELEPTSGSITINDINIRKLPHRKVPHFRRNIGCVFQDFRLLKDRNVYDNVAFAQRVVGASNRSIRQKVPVMLSMVGLAAKYRSFPKQLSGGEQQRVAIARALATNPKVLLCDEATSALDPKTTKQILDLLRKINQEMGVTVIVITHQMSVIEAICDNVAIIDHSHIAESGPVSEVFSNPKTEIGRRLILGDGNANAIQPVNFGDSANPKIRIIFDGQKAHRPIISDIVLSCNAPVNILFANTKEVEGQAVGQMVVELPDSVEEAERITHYLRSNDIRFEEVK